MAVASTALFVALGGVSYGVATGSIDSREVKNNSLRGVDIKRDALTARQIKSRSMVGKDIKPNAVGSTAVKEEALDASKLGKVRSAANADNAADAATLQGNAPSAFQSTSTQLRFGLISMNPGDADRVIGTFDPFTLRAECDPGGGGADLANDTITLTTSENGSDAESDDASDDTFHVGEVLVASSGEDEDDVVSAASPSGYAINGQVYTSDDDVGLGGGCDFYGEMTTVSGG